MIILNECVGAQSVVSAGGSGIACHGGKPVIENNIILKNMGLFGAGVSLSSTGAIIRKNIISENWGGRSFGGSGVWIGGGKDIELIENMIINNSSDKKAAGIEILGSSVILQNNLVTGNKSLTTKEEIVFDENSDCRF